MFLSQLFSYQYLLLEHIEMSRLFVRLSQRNSHWNVAFELQFNDNETIDKKIINQLIS